MPSTNTGARWCFTLNNPTDVDRQRLASAFTDASRRVVYLVVGRETGDSGTPHLQGFVIFNRTVTFAHARDTIGHTAHLERARGTSKQADDYCKKDGDFDEYGTLPGPSGKTNYLDDFFKWADDFREEEGRIPDSRDIALHYPTVLVRHRHIHEVLEARAPHPVLVANPDPRPWQHELEEHLIDDTPDDRVVEFFVDENGGKGKSWFQRHMLTKYPTLVQLLAPAKRDDLALNIDPQKSIFLMNIPKTQMEFLQYTILEQLKDRTVFSPKYMSKMKILPHKCHVVVFSNEYPDMNKMSADRYNVTTLD